MYKKIFIWAILMICIILSSIISFADNSIFDYSKIDTGLIRINFPSKENVKIMIKKDNTKYFYDLNPNTNFPLQLGNGDYTVAVLEKLEGNKYKLITSEKIMLQMKNPNNVFLTSIQMVDWNPNMDAIKKAHILTKDVKNDKEKIEIIYNYIINNINYDNNRTKKISSDYLPSVEDTFKTSKGICYDYTSLFAAMLRSVNVPTKLVMGHTSNIPTYHAWNEVYLKASNEWITIDTVYDACLLKNNLPYTMIKSKNKYTVDKIY
ncbi:MAG: transglutaminase-like domain-containing protein [Marinisporobacter sp.]|jgi:transglutaminase-like putative cysteine protease|nr:transglutaminase-like domain-containing protein [Marinisporobacter sp.]